MMRPFPTAMDKLILPKQQPAHGLGRQAVGGISERRQQHGY